MVSPVRSRRSLVDRRFKPQVRYQNENMKKIISLATSFQQISAKEIKLPRKVPQKSVVQSRL